jgi:hypothetical protein
MKKTYITLIFILNFFLLNAQKIKFEKSLENAKIKAFELKKPIAIFFVIKKPSQSHNGNLVFNNNLVIEKFNSRFVNYLVNVEDTTISKSIMKTYKIYRYPSILFLDQKGGLLFSDLLSLSRPELLIELSDSAIANSNEISLVDFDKTYKSKNKNTAFIKEYIIRRNKAGLINNADLVEEYVASLNNSATLSYEETLFILKAGPYVDSIAFKLCHTNRQIIDSIYATERLSERIKINNAIIANSMKNAIANKNLVRAKAVANFTRQTWSNNYVEGEKNSQLKMLQFYDATKDTINYLEQASVFYDLYYMKLSIDSIKKRDSLNYLQEYSKAIESIKFNPNDTNTTKSYSFIYTKNPDATDLNNAAWKFYLIAKDNNDYLLKAIFWSIRSIELSPKAEFYDTYARLLYRLKRYNESENMEKKAIDLADDEKEDPNIFKETYDKIKKRIL